MSCQCRTPPSICRSVFSSACLTPSVSSPLTFSSPASSTSFRPPGQPSAAPQTRQPTYSSLGEALGTERPTLPSYAQQPPPPPSSLPMSSDGRYMYQHHQQGMTSYDYPSYPHNSYDASQFPQNHPRQQRSSQSHPPPPPSEHVPYNPLHHQPHYHAPYGSAPYAVPHSAPPQWNGEAWPPFSQPVAPPASVQETPVPPNLSRPEPAPVPAPATAPAPAPAPAPQRVYAASPQPQPNAETRRTAGTPKAADPPSQQPKRKPREKEVAVPRHPSPLASSTPLDIDFGKACYYFYFFKDTTACRLTDGIDRYARLCACVQRSS
jgi:hypothetical protein